MHKVRSCWFSHSSKPNSPFSPFKNGTGCHAYGGGAAADLLAHLNQLALSLHSKMAQDVTPMVEAQLHVLGEGINGMAPEALQVCILL